MSDFQFDADICRNICLDIRFVLFFIDKYAGARHLIDEMEIISDWRAECVKDWKA